MSLFMDKTYKRVVFPAVALMLGVFAFVTYVLVGFFYHPVTVRADEEQNRQVQTRLRDWGYYNGEINGVLDWETKQAILSFQAANGLTQSGVIDGQTAQALGIYVGTQNSNDLYLIAKCIYAEARGEPYEGKVAVGAVILNRVKSPDFPNTVYGVVYQPWAFTAVHDGQINLEPDASSYQAAQDAISGWDPTYGCIYYYNPTKATSAWIFSRQTVVTIGKHVFAI